MVYALRYAPKGVVSWLLERAQHPGMVNLRENRTYAHEVAGKLIEEKKQEMKDGTSRRDLLSLLGSSCFIFTRLDAYSNPCFVSQGEFLSATRLATE